MSLAMSQLGALFPGEGLGQAAAVAAILGPLATGGADVFRTYSEGKQSKSELRQRRREFEQLSKLYADRQQAQERQQALAAATALRQQQIRGTYQARYAPYLIGAIAIGGLVLVAIVLTRRGKRGS